MREQSVVSDRYAKCRYRVEDDREEDIVRRDRLPPKQHGSQQRNRRADDEQQRYCACSWTHGCRRNAFIRHRIAGEMG